PLPGADGIDHARTLSINPTRERTRRTRLNSYERTINRLKNIRAVATRYDKRAYVFHGTVAVAAIRLWLRP
ncbi:hypothetical protein ACFWOJ_39055, partial [Streptomyces sp. NPDC058439]